MSNAIQPESIQAAATDPRRHDLDALRAVAMLLGIVLHAAISFIPGPGIWAVADTQTNDVFALLLASIHGFRMPLFFLISGFFTMMLYRKRGLASLLGHRFKRIFLPMMVALVTIIPATWIVSGYVAPGPADVAGGQPAAITDIHVAAAYGDTDAIAGMLDGGVDVDKRNNEGATPLMIAALMGQAGTAELLLERGADPSLRTDKGESVRYMLSVDMGVTQWIAGLFGLKRSNELITQGRAEIGPLLPVPPDGQTDPSTNQASVALAGLMALLFYFPVFGHLWFLWFLCWLVVGFAIAMAVGRSVGIPKPPRWFSASWASYLWLIPLTMLATSMMIEDGMRFGPDTSLGLLPLPRVLAYYAIFFYFGAMHFDASAVDASNADRPTLAHTPCRLGSRWWFTIPVCLFVLFPIGMTVREQAAPAARLISIFSQSAYVWLLSFGLMGLFAKLFATNRPAMRYLSDSSYWLYLAHLPLVIYIQYLVRDFAISPFIKFPIVCVTTSLILLASYQGLVRYTPIGTLLNGKKHRHRKPVLV